MRQVLIYPGEDGFWVAECPSLPGCVSQGGSREAAVTNVREAIQSYVLGLQEDGLSVPGMSADDVFQACVEKNEVNLKRQETGCAVKDHADSMQI